MLRVCLSLCFIVFLTGCGKPHLVCKKSNAYNAAMKIVERHLKAPKTASFPSVNDSGVVVSKVAECSYQVYSYVDSQNSFGAMIRTKFFLDVKGSPEEGDWLGSNLRMD